MKGAPKKPRTIDEYAAGLPEDVRAVLRRLRETIKAAAPAAEERISYGMPAFFLNGRGLISFGAWKNHIGMYPVPAGSAALIRQLAGYRTGKGTLQFPLNKPMPYGLVSRIVKARVREEAARAAASQKRSRGRRKAGSSERAARPARN